MRSLWAEKLRSHLAPDLLQLVVGVGGNQIEEDTSDSSEHPAGTLEFNQSVFEAGRLRLVGDGIRLIQVPGHSLLEGGPVVFLVDSIETVGIRRVMDSR